MRYNLQTVLGYTEDHQINHWYTKQKGAKNETTANGSLQDKWTFRTTPGPMNHCEKTAGGSLQDKWWPFRTTFCFHSFKKFVKSFHRSPPTLFCSNLWMRPFCQILSNVSEMSKNTPHTSQLWSKD